MTDPQPRPDAEEPAIVQALRGMLETMVRDGRRHAKITIVAVEEDPAAALAHLDALKARASEPSEREELLAHMTIERNSLKAELSEARAAVAKRPSELEAERMSAWARAIDSLEVLYNSAVPMYRPGIRYSIATIRHCMLGEAARSEDQQPVAEKAEPSETERDPNDKACRTLFQVRNGLCGAGHVLPRTPAEERAAQCAACLRWVAAKYGFDVRTPPNQWGWASPPPAAEPAAEKAEEKPTRCQVCTHDAHPGRGCEYGPVQDGFGGCDCGWPHGTGKKPTEEKTCKRCGKPLTNREFVGSDEYCSATCSARRDAPYPAPDEKTMAGPVGSVGDAAREDASATPPGEVARRPTHPTGAGHPVERLTREEIASTREFLGPRTYGATLALPWDKANALLSAAERDLSRAEQEREGGERQRFIDTAAIAIMGTHPERPKTPKPRRKKR